MPDVLASTANLLKTNGWRTGAPFGEGTANFEVMSEWNRSVAVRCFGYLQATVGRLRCILLQCQILADTT